MISYPKHSILEAVYYYLVHILLSVLTTALLESAVEEELSAHPRREGNSMKRIKICPQPRKLPTQWAMETPYSVGHGNSLLSGPWKLPTQWAMETPYSVGHGNSLLSGPWKLPTQWAMETPYSVGHGNSLLIGLWKLPTQWAIETPYSVGHRNSLLSGTMHFLQAHRQVKFTGPLYDKTCLWDL